MASAAQPEDSEHLPIQQLLENTETVHELSLEELLYSSSSYHAIALPVSLTMILSALAVVYINTDETIAEGEQALSSAYEAFDNTAGGQATTAETLGLSMLNALIIVSAIGALTFVIVLLYKYRCMKILMGYMIFSSALLLGYLGGVMFDVAINKWQLNIDKFSFYFILWNFAAVGTTSIFWQQGIPKYITQAYLIATSVILAWQLSHFDDWTAWALLVMLALYDLCAVLSPCGPLRALVNLMQRDDAPDMPGLLYEANLPMEARRPGRSRRGQGSTDDQSQVSMSNVRAPSAASTEAPTVVNQQENVADSSVNVGNLPTGIIPLAIAKLYRLGLVVPIEPRRRPSYTPLLEAPGDVIDHPGSHIESSQYSLEQLLSEVEVYFPQGGGRIDRVRNRRGDFRYVVKDRHGEVKRVLFVNQDNGRVMEERSRRDEPDEDHPKDNTIKLGLGDFIFYSLLVSKAVQYSFTTFVACFLVVLAGLGGTLILLAVYQHALPALPISIFLGVIFYILTRLLVEPWIQMIFQSPLYV